jgi:RNA recognition motif-containing protein
MDHPRGRSRGFGFVYFSRTEDAVKAKEYATDTAMGTINNALNSISPF